MEVPPQQYITKNKGYHVKKYCLLGDRKQISDILKAFHASHTSGVN